MYNQSRTTPPVCQTLSLRQRGHRSIERPDGPGEITGNELVANAVVVQNVVDQTQALHRLNANGVEFNVADLAHMSPYWTSNLKLYGDFPTDLKPDPMPTFFGLPS